MPGPSSPSVSLRRGLGEAGKAVHMDLLGERQNGGDFFSSMNQWKNKPILAQREYIFRLKKRVLCRVR